MTFYDDPNRESVGLDPIWESSGDNVPGTINITSDLLDITVALSGGTASTAYDVDFGDGGTGTINTGTAGGGTAQHSYAGAGTYTVTVSLAGVGSVSEDVTVTPIGE